MQQRFAQSAIPKMVGAVGFEPTFSGISKFSLLLIFAFLCANLPAKIQAFTSYFKHYFASLGNNVKKNACRGVSPILSVSNVCRYQSWPVSVSDCVGLVRLADQCKRAVAGHCARLARLAAGLDASRHDFSPYACWRRIFEGRSRKGQPFLASVVGHFVATRLCSP